jgi:hypothetical protein
LLMAHARTSLTQTPLSTWYEVEQALAMQLP